MLTHRERALNTVRHLKISEPQVADLRKEKTLFVTGAPSNWPPVLVAQYALRTALENGCTVIEVQQGIHRRVTFDTMRLFTVARQWRGGRLPTVKMARVPRYIGTWKQAAVGNVLEARPTLIAMPGRTLKPPVSGDPGGQGVTHASE
jgi:hypothetical protein